MGSLNLKLNTKRKYLKGFLKTLLFMAIFLLVLLGSIIALIQIPSVQLRLVSKATDYLSKTLKFPLKIEGIHIDWFDQVVLEGVSIKDLQQQKMIYLGEAKVDFVILSLLKAQINIEKVSLINGQVNLIKYKEGALNMDDFITALGNLSSGGPPTKDTKSSPFVIPSVELVNMYFSFSDVRKPAIPDFDHNHFAIDSIYAEVSNLTAVADTFSIDVKNLRAYETHTLLRVHELDVNYMITGNKMEFNHLFAHIGQSKVKDYLCFGFNNIGEMSDFNEKTVVTSHLENSVVNLSDLAYFAPDLKPYSDKAVISGDFKGRVVNFGVKNLSMAFGRNSVIKGNLKLNGLPELEETFIDFSYNQLRVDTRDLRQYAGKTPYEVLKKFGVITGSGEFVGFANDFVTHGKCVTSIGSLQTDINLKIYENRNPKSYYKGHLKTSAFNFGKLIDQSTLIGLLDMDGEIEGNGFTLSDANVKLVAHISRLGVNNYNYHNITTNAQLSRRLFNGELSINDTNLVFKAVGKVDLTENVNIFNIKAHLEKANLKPLNLNIAGKETIVKTDLLLDYSGLKIDDIEGRASFVNTYLLYNENKEIFIDSLIVESHKKDGNRNFSIESDLLSAFANGDFQFTQLLEDLKRGIHEYTLNVKNDKASIDSYYRNLSHFKRPKYEVDFHVVVQDINAILSIYVPSLYISRGVLISGDYTSGYTSILNLHTRIDTLFFNENELYKTELEISTSKLADSANTLGMLYMRSAAQKIRSSPATENFYFEGIWNNRNIEFQTRIYQQNNSNNALLMGNFAFLENNKKTLSLRNSSIGILNRTWNISGNNSITYAKEEITFNNFSIYNGQQSISMDGTISNDKSKASVLKIDNFNIENINPLLSSMKLKGILNGTVLIRDLYKDIDMEGSVFIHQFTLDNFLIGDIKGASEYNNNSKLLDIRIDVERDEKKIIELSGNIRSNENSNGEALNLTAHLKDANLELLNPILSTVLSDISGTVTGDFNISGTIRKPILKGTGDVKKGKFKVTYLGTNYFFEDKIYLDQNLIGFKKLILSDVNGNHAVVNGGLYHDSFKNFVVDIKGSMKNFNVLNTTEEDNTLFYGTANVTGNLEILGAFSDLSIKANATSNKGTKIYIPLNTTSSLEQKSFIKFKKFGNLKDEKDKDSLDLAGINLEFNFDITPDAYAEIIFDKRAGDIIRGNGQGNMKLKIDTRGDFSMYGDYRITEGYYNFTLAGLINKEFKITPNSSISWSGDPYAGQLNINAVYSQFASLLPIIDTTKSKRPENRRKYPTNVLLNLQGNLMSPVISLGVDILKYPSGISEDVIAFQSKLKSNEQELNRQVFSLLVLGGFSSENSFSGVANSGNNLSELLSNQLSNWLSQVDDNLQIDINLNSLNRDALNTFQLRMSYTLLDGRLRITRDGTFQNMQSSQANLTNIAGEWTVEYLLSKDGNLRLKLFNKANQNILLTSAGNNNSTSSAGFSVLHTQSFSNLRDLLKFDKKKNADEKVPELKTEEAPVQDNSKEDKPEGPVNLLPPPKNKEEEKN